MAPASNTELGAPGAPRRVAVVPAFNEEPTVAKVLEGLAPLVDSLLVVDDGSTDRTRAEIVSWLPGHGHAELLTHETNQGCPRRTTWPSPG